MDENVIILSIKITLLLIFCALASYTIIALLIYLRNQIASSLPKCTTLQSPSFTDYVTFASAIIAAVAVIASSHIASRWQYKIKVEEYSNTAEKSRLKVSSQLLNLQKILIEYSYLRADSTKFSKNRLPNIDFYEIHQTIEYHIPKDYEEKQLLNSIQEHIHDLKYDFIFRDDNKLYDEHLDKSIEKLLILIKTYNLYL